MKKFPLVQAGLIFVIAAIVVAARTYAGFATTVPVSAETATSIARSLFPLSLQVGTGNLYLTDPVVIFIDDRRIGLQAKLQAYEHRPKQGVAISEEGRAAVSGEVGYDPKTRQILLYEPRIDELSFDEDSELTRRLGAQVQAAWRAQVSNPVRADLPAHSFIALFREGIQDVTYEKRQIFIQVWYP